MWFIADFIFTWIVTCNALKRRFKQNTEEYWKLYFRIYFYNGNYIHSTEKQEREVGNMSGGVVGQLQCVQWTEKRERLKTIKFLIMKIYFYLKIVFRFYKTFLYSENYKLFQSSWINIWWFGSFTNSKIQTILKDRPDTDIVLNPSFRDKEKITKSYLNLLIS